MRYKLGFILVCTLVLKYTLFCYAAHYDQLKESCISVIILMYATHSCPLNAYIR